MQVQSSLCLLGVGGNGEGLNLSTSSSSSSSSSTTSSSLGSSSNSSEDITMTPLSSDTSESSESIIIFIGLIGKSLTKALSSRLSHLLGGGLLGALGNKSASSPCSGDPGSSKLFGVL